MNKSGSPRVRGRGTEGFTLIEMLIGLGLFLVISAAALSLFSQHQPLFNRQQNLAGLNIALRNTVAQLELDVVNGGTGYYQGSNIPNWPVGVVVGNNPVAAGTDCRTGTPPVYGPSCFDQLTVVSVDESTPGMHPSVNPVIPGGDANCVAGTGTDTTNTRTLTHLYLIPPAGYTTSQITALAAQFYTNDQILYVSADGSTYTTAVLSAPGATVTSSGVTYIQLTPGTTTTTTVGGTTYYGFNNSSNDPIGLTTVANTQLGENYCPTDYVLRLAPITYKVLLTDPNDPTLVRQVPCHTSASTCVSNVDTETLADQIIGFKVGASQYENGADTDTTTYNFDSSTYILPNNFTSIRSLMISIIGRTPPQTDPTYTFRNSFDGGAYETQGISVVINPRNMSMSD